jgi:hypothetical protein
MKTLIRLLAVAALAAGLVAGTAGPAAAGATGQTTTRFGILELQVIGEGVHVQRTFGRLYTGAWTCNMEFRVFGVGRTGRHWESRSQIARCGAGVVYVIWEEDFEFWPHSNVCLKVGETGRGWEPYYACVRIKP